MHMGPHAFVFYFAAAVDYVESEEAKDDCDIVSCLYGILTLRSEHDHIELGTDDVKRLLSYVINNYEKFDVDEGIYGPLLDEYIALKKRVESTERL